MDKIENIIPTSYKAKLPRTHSYPIGAEALSEAFRNVPQFSKLSLHFHYCATTTVFSSTYLKSVLKRNSYEIFAATFQHIQPGLSSSNQFIERGWYDETWELHIYPVTREFKQAAKNALLNDGIARVEQWLITPRTETWKYGRKSCSVLFSESDGMIQFLQD